MSMGTATSTSARDFAVRRLLPAFVIALATAAYIVARGDASHLASDFDQLWFGARALLRGQNPYDVIGPGRPFDWDYLYYPLPALLLVSPLALAPLMMARAVFGAISAGVLAFAVTRDSPARLLMFLSAPALVALGRGQYGPLILAAAYLPWMSWVGVAKPNIALAVFPVASSLRRALVFGLIGGAVLIAASFVVLPDWLGSWLEALSKRSVETTPVLVRAGGFGILLVLLRWRRPESWMLLALGSIPQTPSFYDTLPLFAIPREFRQTAALTIAANVVFLLFLATLGMDPKTVPTLGERNGAAVLIGLYLPCVWLILRRPNANAAPVASGKPTTRADLLLIACLLISTFFTLWATLSRYHL